MCGIAGYVGKETPSAMPAPTIPLQALEHRGPDDAGSIARGKGQRVLLIHRRLSILDLSAAGHQPMATEDGLFTIVFNGEIYNYRELRTELEKLGHTFRTRTDTEVLLYAFAEWDRACLTRLVGMFAFALLDERRRRLFLARDFFGMKPLYYAHAAEGFAFASEIKALLDWLPIRRTIHPQRLYDYLRFGQTDHGADTMLQEVRQVPAAHYLEVPIDRPDQAQVARYWNLPDDGPLDISFADAARELRALFLDNISLHLRSDVPVGTTLSGGIDSSAITAAIRHVAPETELHAFSYVADDPEVSEERWIDLAGQHARATVHKVSARADDLLEDLETLMRTQDEPFGSTSIHAQYCVFGSARKHGIKVLLGGQGADEMLAGYRHFIPARLSSLIRQGRGLEAWSFARRASRLPGMRGRARLWLQAARGLLPDWATRQADRWLRPNWLNAGWFDARGVLSSRLNDARECDRLRAELKKSMDATSLPALLRYEDRNSMAFSIESRLPFLTPSLANFLLRLPEQYLLGRDGVPKHVFREAMRGLVPDTILDRRDKIGFATPEQKWLRTLWPWVESTLRSDCARSIPALQVEAMLRDVAAVLAGRARFDFRIWRWVNLIHWAQRLNVNFGEAAQQPLAA